MTAAEIITVFEGLVDDSLGQESALALLNAKKDEIEDSRDWSFLMAVQSASGPSFSLPADYKRTVALHVGGLPFSPVPFERRAEFQSGGSPSGSVVHTYQVQTDEIAISGSPVWPERFHKLLAFAMAADFYAVDQEERGRSWDDKWTGSAERMLRAMKDWDIAKYRRSAEAQSPLPSGLYCVDPTADTVTLYQGQAYGVPDVALGIM